MSTRAIRKALRDLQCDYKPCLAGMCRKHDALAEVEAIERAAKAIATPPLDKAGVRAAAVVIASIAKDAP
jgi:hypothetical protein